MIGNVLNVLIIRRPLLRSNPCSICFIAAQLDRLDRWLDSTDSLELRQRSFGYQRFPVQSEVLYDLLVVGARVMVHCSGDHRSLHVELTRRVETKAQLCQTDPMAHPAPIRLQY
jgi:hypothetical protein